MIWSEPATLPFFIYLIAAATSPYLIASTTIGASS